MAEMSFEQVRALTDVPVVVVDDRSVIVEVNTKFEEVFGWLRGEAVGRSLSLIIPPALRDAHHIGFSRFLSTGESVLLGRDLSLPAIDRHGREFSAVHRIVGEKKEGGWRFAASIRPET